jgi:hypothetical protein
MEGVTQATYDAYRVKSRLIGSFQISETTVLQRIGTCIAGENYRVMATLTTSIPFGQDHKSLGVIGTLDDFSFQMREHSCQRLVEFWSLIAAVGEELFQERKHPEQGRHDENAAHRRACPVE